jgi:hypothetical protein
VGAFFAAFQGLGFGPPPTHDGLTWTRVPGSTKADGGAVAAYRGTPASPIVVEAWDRWIADPAIDKLRFQRQS